MVWYTCTVWNDCHHQINEHTHPSPLFFFGVSVVRIHKLYYLSKSQVYNSVLLTTVTFLHIRCLETTHLPAESLYPLTKPPQFPKLQPLVTTTLFSHFQNAIWCGVHWPQTFKCSQNHPTCGSTLARKHDCYSLKFLNFPFKSLKWCLLFLQTSHFNMWLN